MLEHDIRYTYITDMTPLREWIHHPHILPWFPVATEKEIEDSIQCWIGFCRWSSSLTATIHHTPCGIGTLFLMPYQKVAHHAQFKIIVDPKFQRKGIGTSLVRNLKHLAKNYFRLEMIGTELFEGNPMQLLLEQQGFKEIFRQENYIKNGQEGFRTKIYMEVDL